MMKKIITFLSFVLVITMAKAQQPVPSTNQSSTQTSATTTSSTNNDKVVTKDCPIPCTNCDKQCPGKSKDCAGQCVKASATSTSSSSSETMTAVQVNNGAVNVQTSTSSSNKQQCPGKGKSCCKGVSRAMALSGTQAQIQPANTATQGDVPK